MRKGSVAPGMRARNLRQRRLLVVKVYVMRQVLLVKIRSVAIFIGACEELLLAWSRVPFRHVDLQIRLALDAFVAHGAFQFCNQVHAILVST